MNNLERSKNESFYISKKDSTDYKASPRLALKTPISSGKNSVASSVHVEPKSVPKKSKWSTKKKSL